MVRCEVPASLPAISSLRSAVVVTWESLLAASINSGDRLVMLMQKDRATAVRRRSFAEVAGHSKPLAGRESPPGERD